MEKLTLTALERNPYSQEKSNLWKLGLLVLLISLIVYFILIEQAYISAITFVLIGIVYYIYESNQQNKENQTTEVSIINKGIYIGNNFILFEDFNRIEISPAAKGFYLFKFIRDRKIDYYLYFDHDQGTVLYSIINEIENLKVVNKEKSDFLDNITHLLKL